ncbi:hypothetical protein AAHK20_32145 [Trinickia sp. YCB016]
MLPRALWNSLLGHGRRLRRALLVRLPLASIEWLAIAGWCARSLFDARTRWHGIARYEMGRDTLALTPDRALRTVSAAALEKLLDRRVYLSRQHDRASEMWPDLKAIAVELAKQIRQAKEAGAQRPVIVAPFHYVSQYANIEVVDALRAVMGLASIAVVSGVPRDRYGDDEALIPGIRVLYTYGNQNRNGLGMRVARSMRRDGVVVLFADVPPFAMRQYPMETVEVSLHGRPARIHNGVFRIGAPADALLLPFYLRFEHGRFSARVFDLIPLAAPDAPQQVADCIAAALEDNYPQWIMAGHPSMYAFAPVR